MEIGGKAKRNECILMSDGDRIIQYYRRVKVQAHM